MGVARGLRQAVAGDAGQREFRNYTGTEPHSFS